MRPRASPRPRPRPAPPRPAPPCKRPPGRRAKAHCAARGLGPGRDGSSAAGQEGAEQAAGSVAGPRAGGQSRGAAETTCACHSQVRPAGAAAAAGRGEVDRWALGGAIPRPGEAGRGVETLGWHRVSQVLGSLVDCAGCCTRTRRGQALIALTGLAIHRQWHSACGQGERHTLESPEMCPNILGGPGIYHLGEWGERQSWGVRAAISGERLGGGDVLKPNIIDMLTGELQPHGDS